MRVAGVPIQKTHRAVTTRSVAFEFVCRSCGQREPAVVQASVEGTSTNKFRLRDMLIDHEFEAQEAARQDSLALAHGRSAFVPCPTCHYVDERALAAVTAGIRREALVPTVVIAGLVGPALGGLVWGCLQALAISLPDQQQALFDGLLLPILIACTLVVALIARRVTIKRLTRAFDDELIDMQQDVIFRSRDPERYYEIVESGAFTRA